MSTGTDYQANITLQDDYDEYNGLISSESGPKLIKANSRQQVRLCLLLIKQQIIGNTVSKAGMETGTSTTLERNTVLETL